MASCSKANRESQRIDKTESANHATASFDAGTFADRFAQQVEKKLDERESILQGKHTPGSAELSPMARTAPTAPWVPTKRVKDRTVGSIPRRCFIFHLGFVIKKLPPPTTREV
jgi:hypothetical protein